jgi:hypothetical protein
MKTAQIPSATVPEVPATVSPRAAQFARRAFLQAGWSGSVVLTAGAVRSKVDNHHDHHHPHHDHHDHHDHHHDHHH